jgi:Fe2+ transport system protein FeoA
LQPVSESHFVELLPLHLLSERQEGRIVDLLGAEELVTRLDEMGFRPGASVRMVRQGVPCIVAVGDHRMTFRCDDAAVILVAVGTARAEMVAE